MKYSFNDTMELAKKEYGLGKSEYFRPKDGDNRIRVLSAAIPYQSEFKNKLRVQFVCWVIDRADSKIKLYFMPVSILDAIAAFQRDQDYAFEEVPMPYDINIKTEGAGDIKVKYNVVPSPKQTPLTEEEKAAFTEIKDIEEVVQNLKATQNAAPGANSEASEDSGEQLDAAEEAGKEVPF
jgi:hypothetical protein